MVLFGTPDLGASGGILLVLLGAWIIVLAILGIGIVVGIRCLRRVSRIDRWFGMASLLATALVGAAWWVGPPHFYFLLHGRYPLENMKRDEVRKGMTMAEIESRLGKPVARNHVGEGDESWHYDGDWSGMHFLVVCFDKNGLASMFVQD